MFKLDRKLIIAASALSAAAIIATGCNSNGASPSDSKGAYGASRTYDFNGKKVVDGGMYYPTVNGKTSQYLVAVDHGKPQNYGYARLATPAELEAWDKDVTPTSPPPPGKGTAAEGEEIYEEKCIMCHGDFGAGAGGEAGIYPALSKGNAYELHETLTNNRWKDPEADGPTRVFGSYWPQASTLWWYIKDGMPHPNTKSLTDDEVYSLVAYIISINEIKIDGEELDEDAEFNQDTFKKIVMPNVDGFEPEIRGPKGQDNAREYYDKAANFGGQNLNQGAVRCMTNCQKPTAKVVRVDGGITDFLPPMNEVRDMPKPKVAAAPGKKEYESSCKVCHGTAGMGAPVVGEKSDWAKVIAQGMDTVYTNAINGKNGMPPKGGTDYSDATIKQIVDYMANQSK